MLADKEKGDGLRQLLLGDPISGLDEKEKGEGEVLIPGERGKAPVVKRGEGKLRL